MVSAAGSQSNGKANGSSPEKAKKDKAKEPQEKKSKDKKADSSGEAAAAAAVEAPPDPEFDKKLAMVRSVGEECVSDPELRNLLLKKPNFVLYDGFEPSGRMHIAQGVFKAMNVNKCTQAGGTFIFWVADWFALMNDKMGGDLERIRTVGQYLIEVWTAAGMDMSRVKFLWSSDEITKHARGYWTQALDIARRFTIARIKKCCQIMGRKEGSLTAAQILYPLMQCTDIFFLRADVCQLGVDQRKVNMLAREYCDFAGIKLKPIILSHHMLYGLSKGQAKMSKSNKESAIFMEDSPEDVRRKLTNAYCPPEAEAHEEKPEEEQMQLVEDNLKNPCLDYVQHILFSVPGATFTAGGVTYTDYESVRAAFVGKLSESQLKDALVGAVNALLQPVRSHFQQNAEAKRILDLITGWMAEPKGARKTKLRRGVAAAAAAAGETLPRIWYLLRRRRRRCRSRRRSRRSTRCARHPRAPRPCSGSPIGRPSAARACRGEDSADDLKAIDAAYALFVGSLKALAPELMAGVTVCKQSEAILSEASDYWISVINAGRAFPLSALREVHRSIEADAELEPALKEAIASMEAAADAKGAAAALGNAADAMLADGFLKARKVSPSELERVLRPAVTKCEACTSKAEAVLTFRRAADGCLDLGFNASHVVTMLMHVADMLALAPASVGSVASHVPLHELAAKYMRTAEAVVEAGLKPPTIVPVAAASLRLKVPTADPIADAADADAELTLLDSSADIIRKVKRAFCEPSNVAFCPPLTLSRRLLLPYGAASLVLTRKPEDGGDVTFHDAAALEQAYASGGVHPGDLKPVVRDGTDALLQKVRKAIKADAKLGAAEKEVLKVAKRAAKK